MFFTPSLSLAQQTNYEAKGKIQIWHEVSGLVADTNGTPIAAATIKLIANEDTLVSSSNDEGIFIFEKVRSPVFLLVIHAIGYQLAIRKYYYNNDKKIIVLDPINISLKIDTLKEVKFNGKSSILYKTDTVEYKASDYYAPKNAVVADLLKSMEGMEIGTDGSLKYQGQQVKIAKLNGKEFAGGDVPQAINNLPADIIEKVQIIDDYGDLAEKTGIKNGDYTKTINLSTKKDKSIGHFGNVTTSYGNNDRYKENLFYLNVDGNRQFTVLGSAQNVVNGVANLASAGNNQMFTPTSDQSADGSGGTTTALSSNISYRNSWGNTLQLNFDYGYNYRIVRLISNSDGQLFSNLGTIYTTTEATGINYLKTHKIKMELEFTPNRFDYLEFTPYFNYKELTGQNYDNLVQTGLTNQTLTDNSNLKNDLPEFGSYLLYEHVFAKKGRIFSFLSEIDINHETKIINDKNEILYQDSTQNKIKDSLLNRVNARSNFSSISKTTLSYIEPIGDISQLQFTEKFDFSTANVSILSNNFNSSNDLMPIDSLSGKFKYRFLQNTVSANYNISLKKLKCSVGVSMMPTRSGISSLTNENSYTNNIFITPVLKLQYLFSQTEQWSFSYHSQVLPPTTIQVQPIPDFTSLLNPIYGNLSLKPTFNHNINMIYNNYVANDRLNITGNVTGSFVRNEISTNTLVVIQPTSDNYLYETHFINLNGDYNVQCNYNLAKQLTDREYNLELYGTIQYYNIVGVFNNQSATTEIWKTDERFGPRINPNEIIEINPYISYDTYTSDNSLPGSLNSHLDIAAISFENKIHLSNSTFSYTINKNYISGLNSYISKSPLVINASVESRFLANKNGTVKIEIFDLLNQNKFINRIITENSVTDIKTNALSRYLMVSIIINLQKWTGTPSKNGQPLKRRNDGSFIN